MNEDDGKRGDIVGNQGRGGVAMMGNFVVSGLGGEL
jgi:hypothetical protein